MKTMAILFLATISTIALGLGAGAEEIIVSAAISLQDAFDEIGSAFERASPSVTVRFNYGSSGKLQTQIENGAPVDVFASAASKQMNILIDKGLVIEETIHDFATGVVVLIRPIDSKPKADSFNELGKTEIKRIALGNPVTVPAGQYAQEVLRSIKLWDSLRPKLIYAENVRQVLNYVVRGEVDAGIVYSTDARKAGGQIRVVEKAPEGSHRPVVYPLAVVKSSTNRLLAERFIHFVLSTEGQGILARHGFGSGI